MNALPAEATSRALIQRLWRQQVSRHRPVILAAIFCTIAVAGLTALYPVVIQQAANLFTSGDARIIWLIPPLIIALTVAKALAQYGQAVFI